MYVSEADSEKPEVLAWYFDTDEDALNIVTAEDPSTILSSDELKAKFVVEYFEEEEDGLMNGYELEVRTATSGAYKGFGIVKGNDLTINIADDLAWAIINETTVVSADDNESAHLDDLMDMLGIEATENAYEYVMKTDATSEEVTFVGGDEIATETCAGDSYDTNGTGTNAKWYAKLNDPPATLTGNASSAIALHDDEVAGDGNVIEDEADTGTYYVGIGKAFKLTITFGTAVEDSANTTGYKFTAAGTSCSVGTIAETFPADTAITNDVTTQDITLTITAVAAASYSIAITMAAIDG